MSIASCSKNVIGPAAAVPTLQSDGLQFLAGSGLADLDALLSGDDGRRQLLQVTLDGLQLTPGLLDLMAALGARVGG
jgi:hypothetical protein